MNERIDIAADLADRVHGVARRLGVSDADIIRDALENGHSLEWQEAWFHQVQAGLNAAEGGDFSSEAETAELLARFRQP